MMTKTDLKSTEFNHYYLQYIDKLSAELELRKGYVAGEKMVLDFFAAIPEEKLTYRYAPGKWSIKEIFQHLIDTERIFMHRCFRIARNDQTALAGYDQNVYIKPSNADNKSIQNLLDEYKATRQYSIALLHSLTDEDLKSIGNANGGVMSARSAAFLILGHDIWHIEVIKERYL